MTKYMKHICPLLLLLIFITSCDGQDKTQLSKDSAGEPKTVLAGQTKIMKRNIIILI